MPRRKSGFEKPWHPLQVATWALFPVILVHYFAFLMPLLWTHIAVKVIITFFFGLSAVASVVACYYTCSVDPVDDALIGQNANGLGSSTETIYCYLCETNVHHSSKHCRFCDKCVVKFDHHCKWLNTCVGSKNYKYFLSVVAAVGVMTSISLALSMAYVIEAFAYPETIRGRLHYINEMSQRQPAENEVLLFPLLGLKIIAIASVTVLLPLCMMIYQLAGFHMMLIQRGMTTYDFIVYEQKKMREKMMGENSAPAPRPIQAPAPAPVSPPVPPPALPGYGYESPGGGQLLPREERQQQQNGLPRSAQGDDDQDNGVDRLEAAVPSTDSSSQQAQRNGNGYYPGGNPDEKIDERRNH